VAAGLREAASGVVLHEPSALVGGACRRGVATGGVATGRLVTEGSSGALRAGVFEVLRAGATARVQAAARGCRRLRVVEWVAEDITGRVAREVQALHGDAKARIRVGDELMRLLLRIDAVRGARDYQRRVARRVLKLQDDVNALEQSPVVEEVEAEAADLSGSEENNSKMEDKLAAEMATEVEVEVEVDGDRAVRDGVESMNLGTDEPADEDAKGHCQWELVAEEPEAALPTAPHVLHLIEGQ
jgi:hypothetical protein